MIRFGISWVARLLGVSGFTVQQPTTRGSLQDLNISEKVVLSADPETTIATITEKMTEEVDESMAKETDLSEIESESEVMAEERDEAKPAEEPKAKPAE